jgi:hypothetical protein
LWVNSEIEGLDELLSILGGKRHLRGVGRMGKAETALHSLEAVEAPLYASKEPDAARIIGGYCMKSATNGCGPWWNAGAAHMHKAVPKSYFDKLGLVSLMSQYHRLQHTS